MSAFWNTGLHARRQYAFETDCDRPNLHRSSVVFLRLIQIAELLSRFHFLFHIYHVALSKLLLRFRLKRSALQQRYKNFLTLHPSKQKLQVKKFGLTAHILSRQPTYSDSPLRHHTYSDGPLPVTLCTQTFHFLSFCLLKHSTSRYPTYSDGPLRHLPTQTVNFFTTPTQTVHFPSPYLLTHFTSCHFAYIDSPLPVTLPTQTVHFVTIPTQTVHFPSPFLLRQSTSSP